MGGVNSSALGSLSEQEYHARATKFSLDQSIKNVQNNPNIPNFGKDDIGANIVALQNTVYVEGVRPRQTYVYRPGGIDVGPVIFNDFSKLYEMMNQNAIMCIETTIVMDDSITSNIVISPPSDDTSGYYPYFLNLCTLQGYKESQNLRTSVTIGDKCCLINLHGLDKIDLNLGTVNTFPKVNFERNPIMNQININGNINLSITDNNNLTFTMSNSSILAPTNITDNSNYIKFYNQLDEFRMHLILQNESTIPKTNNDYAYISVGRNDINLSISINTNSKIDNSVFYANDDSTSNIVITAISDNVQNLIVPPLTYSDNIAFNSSVLTTANNILYDTSSTLVPSPAISGAVTIKEQIDAIVELTGNDTFTNLIVKQGVNPSIFSASTTNNSVDIDSNTTNINSGTIGIGTGNNYDNTTINSNTTNVNSNTTNINSGTIGIGTGNNNDNTTIYSHAIVIGTGNNYDTTTIYSTDLVVGTGTGGTTAIKSAAIGFYGATPSAQPVASGNTNTNVAGSSGVVYCDTTFGTGNWTIADVVNALQSIGLLKQ